MEGLFGEVFDEDVFEPDFELVVFVNLQGDVAGAAYVAVLVYGIVEHAAAIIVSDRNAVEDSGNLVTDGGYLQAVPAGELVAVTED